MTVAALHSVASNSALRSSMQRARSNPALRASAAVGSSAVLHAVPPQMPVRPFVSSVLLTRDAYESKRVTELKGELKQRGLATTGKRVDLIQRLLDNDHNKLKVLPISASKMKKSIAKARNASTEAAKSKTDDIAPQHSAGVVGADAQGATISHPPDMEPGQISANFHDPNKGGVVAPEQLEAHANAPGVPPEKTAATPSTFEFQIPYEPEPVEQQIDIPLMTSYFHPEESHFSGQYQEGDGPIAHEPKVRTVSGEETYLGGGVAHHQPTFENHILGAGQSTGQSGGNKQDTGSSLGSAVSSLWSSVQKDLGLATEANAPVAKQAQQVGESAKGLLKAARDTLNSAGITRTGSKGSGSSSASYSTSAQSSKNDSTRPLNADERSGLYLLGGIFAGGFLLGGLGKQSKRKSKKVHDEIKKSVDEARKEAKAVSDAELSSLVARAELALK